MILILLGQLAIPTLLAAWMLVRPLRSVAGLATQLAGSLFALGALGRVGLWLFPPWWFPYAAAAAVLVGAALHAKRAWNTGLLPRGIGWAGTVFFAGLSVTGEAFMTKAGLGARMPTEPSAVDLAFPLPAGRYLIANGGAAVMLNAHRESMDTTILELRPWRGNGHAVDIVATNALGLRAPGLLPGDPAVYRIFGVHVLAPCPGSVVTAVDGLPDLSVPEYDKANLAGNHVILDCTGVHVVVAHLQKGSVRVRAGDAIETGVVLGSVGNSGGTSEPHLHIHAQRPGPVGAPFGGDPLPMRFDDRYLVRGDRVTVPE